MWYVIVFIAGFLLGTKFGPKAWSKVSDKLDNLYRRCDCGRLRREDR